MTTQNSEQGKTPLDTLIEQQLSIRLDEHIWSTENEAKLAQLLREQAAELTTKTVLVNQHHERVKFLEAELAKVTRERDALREKVERVSGLIEEMDGEYTASLTTMEAHLQDTSNVERVLGWCERLAALLK